MLNGNLKRGRKNRNLLHILKELERKKESRVVENSENQMGGASTVYVLGVNWWEGRGSKCWPVDRGGEVLYHSVALYISNVEPTSHNLGRSCRGFKGWVQRIRFLFFSFVIIR